MDRKLTVRVPRHLLINAKRYAQAHQTTLTELIATYLQQIPSETVILDHAPVVRHLTGLISSEVTADHYKKHLEKKYGAAGKLQVLFDLNIILDVLQERKDFYHFSARLLAYAETGIIQGWLAAHSVTTLFYLIAKDKSPDQARVTLTSLLQFLKIAPVNQETIEQALNLPYRDFEDAVQMVAALHIHCRLFSNPECRDFQPAPMEVLQPVELLAILNL